MNSTNPLTAQMITDPTFYRLTLRISPDALEIYITSRVNGDETIYRRLPLGTDTPAITAIEEIVYENPLLTSDFHSVEILLDNNRFFIMDATDALDADNTKSRIQKLWPAEQNTVEIQPIVNTIEPGRTTLIAVIERPLAAFLRRTWNNPSIRHRMTILARYHALRNNIGNMGKIHVYIQPQSMDMLVYGREGLYAANSFTTATIDDAAFYILAAAKHFDFDNDNDRVYVDGTPARRDQLISRLRQFIPTVLPQIIPSETANTNPALSPETRIANLM